MPTVAERRTELLKNAVVVKTLKASLAEGARVEVKTRYGQWRFVGAVYSDDTLGTVRATGDYRRGRFTIVNVNAVHDWRHADS
jgi:hypothetical protein